MKQIAIALVLILTATGVAHLHATSQTYHPVVKVSAPNGVTFTAVLAATDDRPSCAVANRRFLVPMRANCSDCEVAAARCERELEGLELALSLDLPVPYPVVSVPGARLAITTDDAAASSTSTCESIAGDVIKRGVGAECAKAAPTAIR